MTRKVYRVGISIDGEQVQFEDGPAHLSREGISHETEALRDGITLVGLVFGELAHDALAPGPKSGKLSAG